MWQAGETIVHQEVWGGRVWAARPLIVVEDAADRLLLWLPRGTTRKVPAPRPTSPDPERDPLALDGEASHRGVIENLLRRDWEHVDHEWDVSSLWMVRPGDWHAVWVSWLGSGAHLGWYVNFQRPFRRTAIGIEAMDLMLDIVVEPDLTWRWKDAAEFDEIVARGVFDASMAARVRDEAREVVRRIEGGGAPFGDPWPAWRPPGGWSLPILPDGWDERRP